MRITVPLEVTYIKSYEVSYVIQRTGSTIWYDWVTRGECPPEQVNPWELRKKFFLTGTTAEEILAFLNQVGEWNGFKYLSLEDVLESKRLLTRLIDTNPIDWETLYDEFNEQLVDHVIYLSDLKLEWRRQRLPFIKLDPIDALTAITSSIIVDHVSGSTFRWCAEPSCGLPFPKFPNSRQKYCSRECNHRDTMRRRRGALGPSSGAGTRVTR